MVYRAVGSATGILAVLCLVGVAVALAAAQAAADSPLDIFAAPVEDPETPHFYYAFEKPLSGYRDTITVKVGDQYERKNNPVQQGKVLEWGTLVYFWDQYGQKHTYRRPDVQKFEIRRDDFAKRKPDLPDLTVAYIERLPRDPGWHGQVQYQVEGKRDLPVLVADPAKYPLHPTPGQQVTFVIHILNGGSVPTGRPFRYRVLMDDREISQGQIEASLAPRAEELVEVPWRWQDGQHYIKVLLDTGDVVEEIAEWNNSFLDPVRALTFFFVVSRNVVEGFAESLNCVDTFCFEDWAQYHVHMMNWLFAESVYPSAPNGILERVRIDKIIIAEDARDPEERKKWEPIRHRNGDVDDIIEYNGNWEFGKVESREHAAKWAQQVDWGLPHELAHQLGLVDIYQLNTSIHDCLVKNQEGFYANVHHFFPAPQTMMHWHGPHTFSEQCAGYMNQTLGRPRGYFGDYLYALPEKNYLQVLSNTGKPLAGAQIDLFQRNAWEPYAHRVGPDPIASGKTDSDGLYFMPNRPAPSHTTWQGYELRDNPWGHIQVVGMNGMILVRLRHSGYEEFHWLRILDFNVARFRGHEDEFTYEIRSRFPDLGAPDPPQNLTAFWHRPPGEPRLELIWEPSASSDIVEYRVYRKDSHGGQTVKPFVCYGTVPIDRAHADGRFRSGAEHGKEFEFKGFYSKDNYFAVAAVDTNGRESGLSNVLYVPQMHDNNKLAVGPDGAVYFTVTGSNENQLLRWTAERGLHEFGLRAPNVPGYHPAFGGVAVDLQGQFLVTDPRAHQLAFYDSNGDLVKLVGTPDRKLSAKPGEFNEPTDVAVDSNGRIYVADMRNHRIEVFDPEGTFLYEFGTQGSGDMQFEEPSALGCLGTTLCVTDRKLRRVLVFDVSGERPTQVRELPDLRSPDRALVTDSGMAYVCCRDDEDEWAIVAYLPDGRIHARIRDTEGRRVEVPKGLYPDGEGNAYFVTDFPPEVLKIRLD